MLRVSKMVAIILVTDTVTSEEVSTIKFEIIKQILFRMLSRLELIFL